MPRTGYRVWIFYLNITMKNSNIKEKNQILGGEQKLASEAILKQKEEEVKLQLAEAEAQLIAQKQENEKNKSKPR